MEIVWRYVVYGVWFISFLIGLLGMKYAIDVGLIPPQSGTLADWQIAIIAATIPTLLYPLRGYIEERNIIIFKYKIYKGLKFSS